MTIHWLCDMMFLDNGILIAVLIFFEISSFFWLLMKHLYHRIKLEGYKYFANIILNMFIVVVMVIVRFRIDA